MIKNPEIWAEFKRNQTRSHAADYEQNLKLFEGLWNEAIALGVVPLADPLTGIESDILVARVLNSCSKSC